jgi:virginiamycin B lyase
MKRFLATSGLVVFMAVAAGGRLPAAEATGLTGVVTSEAEGPMEGVLVSAKRIPGTITVTVVSDKSGTYSFPTGRLAPGTYHLAVRAIGYDLADPEMAVTIGKETGRANIKLVKAADLAGQMSDIEWLMSAPGPQEQKEYLFRTCSHCHTLTPIFGSNYDAAGWMTTFARMRGWDQVSSINAPVKSPDRGGAPFGNEEFARFLSTINLSSGPTHNFELKTLPRPKGADTKVIITEYDLPRADAEPHDVVPDKEGMIWYPDFREGLVGRLNPSNGETKEWPNPVVKAGFPSGFQDLERDSEGNIWVGRHDWNGVAKFDRKTEKFTNFDFPEGAKTDFVSVGADGKVWVKDNDGHALFRITPATGEMKKFDQYPPELMARNYSGPKHNIYGISADSKGNVYEADIEGGYLFRVVGETGKVSPFPIPTKDAGPRRMHVDSRDQVWIGEYYGKKIAMFDPATEQFREWNPPLPWYGAYDVAVDKDGFAWTGTMTSDVILRLDPKSGEFRQYLLPTLGVNVRRVEVDNSGPRPAFWVGENHRAKIAKVEPLP